MAARNTPLCSLAHRAVLREFEQLPDDAEQALRDELDAARALPHPGEHSKIDRMGGQHDELFRLRVGDYRAILDYHMGHIRVLVVAHRQNAYREDNLAKAKLRHRQR